MLLLLLLCSHLPFSSQYIVNPAEHEAAPYAEWAHYHWVWLSNDRATQQNLIDFANSFAEHNIPVGAVDVDSGWETGFNNFIFDTKKIPNATQMVKEFHNNGTRIIFWITSMVDEDSSNYNEGLTNKYYISHPNGKACVYKWWHGNGSLVDYSNPDALKWWHKQMDNVLSTGIDGWKTDGTDPYILETPEAVAFQGNITYRDYANFYYGDFFNYTRQVNGMDCLIMSRPVDGVQYHTPLYLAFSPRYLMFSGWTGDDDSDFGGLRSAITKFLLSAEASYANYGSDIGGYRTDGSPLGRTRQAFTRWFQTCAFVPLMENGGNGIHTPWSFDDPNSTEVVDTYRKFVTAHYELVPYLLTIGTEAWEKNSSSLHPVVPVKLVDLITPDFDFFLGTDYLICPMVYNDTVRNITFPGNSSITYTSYWNPRETYKGNTTVLYYVPWTTSPVFIVNGSMVPLRIVTNLTGRGSAHFPKAMTISINRPTFNGQWVRRIVREFKRPGLNLGYRFSALNNNSALLQFESSAFTPHSFKNKTDVPAHRHVADRLENYIYDEIIFSVDGICNCENLLIFQKTETGMIQLSEKEELENLAPSFGYFYDKFLQRLLVRPTNSHNGVQINVTGALSLCD